MKSIIITLGLVISFCVCVAQTPQFAVVRPNGTTYIYQSWDSAYNKAVNGDNIYLPGVTINRSLDIDKRLNIYGAGHHPDSTSATGRTSVVGNVRLYSGSSGGILEGIQVSEHIYLQYSGGKIRDLTIKRCRCNILYLTFNAPLDSVSTNITISENLMSQLWGNNSSGSTLSKNIIQGNFGDVKNSYIINNILNCQGNSFTGFDYNIFENNIFLAGQPFYNATTCTNIFNNNLKLSGSPLLAGCPANIGIETNTIVVNSLDNIFLSYSTNNTGYPYIDNYHLKPTCPGVNAGTDGTDVGIYGTTQPTSEGWVPSNPHIYFKQVAAQTNNSGQLNIQFKVRTNN